MSILAYLGWDAYPIARMNGDPASRRVRADMKRWGVRLDFASCTPSSDTPIIVQEIRRGRDGSPVHRFSWACPSCGQWLPSFKSVTTDAVETVAAKLPGASVFFMDRLSRAALSLAEQASEEGAVIVFEPSGKSDARLLAEALKLAHIVKYADQRLAAIDGVMARGSATLVEIQTMGSTGLRFRHRLSRRLSAWTHLPAIPAPTLADSCGSGDWCTAGLLARATEGGLNGLRRAGVAGIEEGLRFGQAMAAWNCGFEGARGGMYAVDQTVFSAQVNAILTGRPQPISKPMTKMQNSPVACPACPPNEPRARHVRSQRSSRATS
jgi:fructokinase